MKLLDAIAKRNFQNTEEKGAAKKENRKPKEWVIIERAVDGFSVVRKDFAEKKCLKIVEDKR